MLYMPYLVDGNNLFFAFRKAGEAMGRSGLAQRLGQLADITGQRVAVVFDGPAPQGALAEQVGDERIEVVFAGARTADAVLCERIEADSAPRRLVVVSTDHEIRRAARRRRCHGIRSEDFLDILAAMIERSERPRKGEPPQKRQGLTSQQAREWLKEFNLDEESQE
jgi:predicted RNA-binding protein with PIN domain